MFLAQLALIGTVVLAQPSTRICEDLCTIDSVENPFDTMPAVELSTSPLFILNESGEDSVYLDSIYAILRELLTASITNGWEGNFSFDDLCKRFPKVKRFETFRPAEFLVSGSNGRVYVTYMQNEGFLPTIGVVNDSKEKVLEFFFSTSHGRTVAKALLVTANKKGG